MPKLKLVGNAEAYTMLAPYSQLVPGSKNPRAEFRGSKEEIHGVNYIVLDTYCKIGFGEVTIYFGARNQVFVHGLDKFMDDLEPNDRINMIVADGNVIMIRHQPGYDYPAYLTVLEDN